MKQFNRELGKIGENEAASYLGKKGYRVLERNYYTRFGEIDLICAHSNSSGQERLVFVEVKLKQGEDFGTPEEMIDKRKLSQAERMANFYLMANPQISEKYSSFSIDAVCIVVDENRRVKRLNHYENLTF